LVTVLAPRGFVLDNAESASRIGERVTEWVRQNMRRPALGRSVQVDDAARLA
jgi:hypothetical protein